MYAQIMNKFGSSDVFEIAKIDKPIPKTGEVLIRVKGSSVNHIDIEIRSGAMPKLAPEFPAVLHGDVSGIIEELGPDVEEFDIGDSVFGYCGGVKGLGGALAEYMAVDSKLISKIPKGIDYLEAALYPLVALTAWEAIIEKGNVKENDKVLIQGDIEGIGHMAIQLAKWKGAKVFAIVNKEEMIVANLFGADVVIDNNVMTSKEYTEIYTENKGFDIVFDAIGGAHLEKIFETVKINGKIITTLALGNYNLSQIYRKSATLSPVFMETPLLEGINRQEQGNKMKQIAELIELGKLKVFKDKKQFGIRDINKAHEYMESRENNGKISIVF